MSSNEIRIHKTLARCGILAVVLLATLCRCARQAAPQGGPRDSLPPKVVTMTPAFGTTHFKDKRILIEFDEYVQLEDQQKEFFTSPFMEQKPVLSIRGRSVQIDLKEDLDSNRTYALDFGSSVVDNNEGNPYVGLRYVFSTGGEIDSLLMSGYTVDAQKGDTLGKVFLLFFDAKADSIPAYDSTIVNSKPLSVARSYPNGIFIAENLKPTDYRIYALEDNNNNMRYEPGVDRVAFLDTVFNPLREPAFDIWYDTSRRYMQADPQLMMRLFKEIPSKRQTYTGASRPQSNRVTLMFSAPFPQIDTLVFEGFDPSKILTEYVTPRRDTMTLWFDAIEEEMPDTLKGRLVYRKHDSTGVLQSAGQDLAIAWRRPAKKEKEKEKEKKDDALEPNPFKVKVAGGTTLNPEKNIVFDFDYPLTRVDSTAIDLQRLGEGESSEPVKVSFVQDTAKLRSWTLSAPWVAGEKYRLTIPAGTFANTNRESNDTLRSEFTIESPEKYGTLILNVKGKTPQSEYVIEVLRDGRVQKEIPHVRSGTHTIRYVDVGTIKLRFIEDLNGNGKWDTGSVFERRQPERVEYFVDKSGTEEIVTKENWDLEYDVDMNELFGPITMERMQEKIRRDEQARLREIAKKRAEREKNGRHSSAAGGNRNNSNNYNGYGNTGGLGGTGGMIRR